MIGVMEEELFTYCRLHEENWSSQLHQIGLDTAQQQNLSSACIAEKIILNFKLRRSMLGHQSSKRKASADVGLTGCMLPQNVVDPRVA